MVKYEIEREANHNGKNELLKILNKIEEEGRKEVRYSNYETEAQHSYGMMDAVIQLKKKLNIED